MEMIICMDFLIANQYKNSCFFVTFALFFLLIFVLITLRRFDATTRIRMTTKNELLNTLNELRAKNGDDEIAKFSKSKSALEIVIAEYRESIGDDGTMSVADLARDLGMSPKIARAKLRRRGIFAKNGAHVRFVRDDAMFVKYHAIVTSQRVAVDNDDA